MVHVAHRQDVREPLGEPVEVIVDEGPALPQADPVRGGHLGALERPRVNETLALAEYARDLAVRLVP